MFNRLYKSEVTITSKNSKNREHIHLIHTAKMVRQLFIVSMRQTTMIITKLTPTEMEALQHSHLIIQTSITNRYAEVQFCGGNFCPAQQCFSCGHADKLILIIPEVLTSIGISQICLLVQIMIMCF